MTLRRGSEEASASIWSWQPTDRRVEARRARVGGALRGAVGALVGGAFFYFSQASMAYVVWSISSLLTALALVSPLGAHTKVLSGMDVAGRWVGRLVGWVLLTPVYLFFFVPFRVLFRSGARDAMKRRIDPRASTYWTTRQEDAQVLPMKRPY